MTKIVADTNILVSASFWKGKPYNIIKLAAHGKIEIFSSTEILEEFAKVLKRDFKTEENELKERIETFLEILSIVEPKIKINEIKEDPDDNKVLEVAIEAMVDYIVSGDKHLLKLQEFRGIKIVKAREFLEIIEKERR